jgi:hypothetical protein
VTETVESVETKVETVGVIRPDELDAEATLGDMVDDGRLDPVVEVSEGRSSELD